MNIVIIGGSAAGISAAKEIVKKGKSNKVTIVYEENNYPYYRPLLPDYLADNEAIKKKNFYLNSSEWYKENICLIPNTRIESIDPSNFQLTTAKKDTISFDKLIIASGSSPFVPFKHIMENSNAHTLRTLTDTEKIRRELGTAKNAVIIGGGLLGLEIASSLSKAALNVSVIELSTRLLPKQIDEKTSLFLKDIIKTTGIEIYTGVSVGKIDANRTKINSLTLSSGEKVPADLVIVSIGTRANKDFAQNVLETDKGIIVNNKMETSIPGIYACGDAAQFGSTPALWVPAVKEGRVAGDNASEGNFIFSGENYPAVLNSFGTKIYSIGEISIDNDFNFSHTQGSFQKKNYIRMFYSDQKVHGGILVGNIGKSRILSDCIKMGLNIEKTLEKLK